MTYQYDFFLSYSRKNPVGNWVRNHFCPELRQWLDSYTAQPARIFIDQDIEVGDFWPNHLESALRASKYLIAIWSPQYFTSPWCRAEWQSMRERELILNLHRGTAGLVYPVVFSDGKNFPPEAGRAQRIDFSDVNYPHLSFRDAQKYLEFVDRMKRVSEMLAGWIDEREAPAFDPQWPIVRPEPGSAPVAPLPRIG
jgi:hypothetical protein